MEKLKQLNPKTLILFIYHLRIWNISKLSFSCNSVSSSMAYKTSHIHQHCYAHFHRLMISVSIAQKPSVFHHSLLISPFLFHATNTLAVLSITTLHVIHASLSSYPVRLLEVLLILNRTDLNPLLSSSSFSKNFNDSFCYRHCDDNQVMRRKGWSRTYTPSPYLPLYIYSSKLLLPYKILLINLNGIHQWMVITTMVFIISSEICIFNVIWSDTIEDLKIF